MNKTNRYIIRCYYLLILVMIFSSYLPIASASTLCVHDDLDTDVEWVSEGSLSIKWGQVKEIEVNEVEYTLRADDFDDLDGASISIEKNGDVKTQFVFLNAGSHSWFQWDHDIKVELTDITEDSYKTPSAVIKVYSRGLPELDIEIEGSKETVEDVEVSSEQYAPGEEKQIDIEIKNTGDGWIENVILQVDVSDLYIRDKGEFQVKNGILWKNLGCFETDDSIELNFTVVAPEWDGETSPYDINYAINATATGDDIKEDSHEFEGSLNLECTEPDLKVVLEATKEEFNMTSWYVNKLENNADTYSSDDYEIKDAEEFVILRTRVYNTGLYAFDDLNISFSEIPDELVIMDTYGSGSYSQMEADGQYYLGQKMVAIRPGKYSFDKVVVTTDFFGETLSWESKEESVTVHGPYVIPVKSLKKSGDEYTVSLSLLNDGDRACWINVTETIPGSVNYVSGSLEKTLEGSDLPLSEWDMSTALIDEAHIFTIDGVLLPPGSTLNFGYSFTSDEAPDLPAAVCQFRSLVGYEAETRSSFYENGQEIKQYWDPFNSKWVVESETEETSVDEETKTAEDSSTVDEDSFASVEDTSGENEQLLNENLYQLTDEENNGTLSHLIQMVISPFEELYSGAMSIFGTFESLL